MHNKVNGSVTSAEELIQSHLNYFYENVVDNSSGGRTEEVPPRKGMVSWSFGDLNFIYKTRFKKTIVENIKLMTG